MGRPVTHAAGWLARRLEQNRLEPRVRRMLGKLQRELHASTWETLRALVLGRLARRELLIQQREAHLLADPAAEGGKWLLGLWAAQRRDMELVGLLERMGNPADRPPPLEAYLAARCQAAVAPHNGRQKTKSGDPEASRTDEKAPVEVSTSADRDDAPDGPAGGRVSSKKVEAAT